MNRILFFSVVFLLLVTKPTFTQHFTETISGLWGGDKLLGEHSAFYDIDNDGNQDIVIGHGDGTLSHYEQSPGPDFTKFQFISDNFNEIDVGPYWAKPVMEDINNDGLVELIVGDYYGELELFTQISPNSYEFYQITDEFNQIDVDGGFASPTFTDLDNDGLLDLVIGTYYGGFYHYEQETTNSFTFILIDDYFNSIDIGDYSIPYFMDIDGDDLLDLIIGERYGKLFHYEQDAINSEDFTLITNNFNEIDIGYFSSPNIFDMDSDGLLEILIGDENEDGFNLFRQDAIYSYTFNVVSNNLHSYYDFGYYVEPTISDFDQDGLFDLIIGQNNGTLSHYEQESFNSTNFLLVTPNFSSIDVGSYASPAIIDIDGDGLLDLLIGENLGNINHYKQAGPLASYFILVDENFNGINTTYAKPCFADFNNNGLIDLIIGRSNGSLSYYEQDSPLSEIFNLVNDYFSDIDIGGQSAPFFTLEDDGLYSLLIGNSNGFVYKYKQNSVSSNSFDLVSNNFFENDYGYNVSPVGIDITGNGFTDYFIGNSDGFIYHLLASLDCVSLVEPINNSVSNEATTQLAWNQGQLADGYLVYLGTDNPPTNILNGFDNGTDTLFSTAPLLFDQDYYWSVKAYSAEDTSDLNQVWSFKTIQLENLPYSELNNLSIFPKNINVETNLLTSGVWSLSKSSNAGGVNFELKAEQTNETGQARLILPPITTLGLTSIELQFDQFFDDIAPGIEMRIESSADGVLWTPEPWSQLSGSGNYGPETNSTTITNNLGFITYVSFLIIGDFNNFDCWYLDNLFLFDPIDVPPVSFPKNPNSFSIARITDTLKWYETPNTDNYQLFLGTDNPPSNILNGIVVNDPFYIPDYNVPFGDTVYWQVVPQNSYGNANNYATWSFKTDISQYIWGKALNNTFPSFADFNYDGYLDLLVGTGSHYEHFEQSKTDPFKFEIINSDFSGIENLAVFCDIDNDGLLDALSGSTGKIFHYVQESAKSNKFNLVSENFSSIDLGSSCNPTIIDIDNDNLLDLIIGVYGGYMYHYEQLYESSLTFRLVSNYFNNIEICDYCRPRPYFTDPDNDGYLDLYIGGYGIKHYKQSTYNPNGFYFVDEEGFWSNASPTFTDLDNDGLLDNIIGGWDGPLFHREQASSGSYNFDSISDNFLSDIIIDVGRYSKPAFLDIDNNGLLDVLIGNEDGDIIHYEADEPNSFNFSLISSNFSWINVGGRAKITATDIDNDNMIDLLIGGDNYQIYRYEQASPGYLIFNLFTEDLLGENISYPDPAVEDIDNDGLIDLLVGDGQGKIHHYEQDAIISSNFIFITDNFSGIDVGNNASPSFCDTDYDGLSELIIGNSSGSVYKYEQDSIDSYTFNLIDGIPLDIPISTYSAPTITDIDNNGIFDLVVGDFTGGIYHTKLDLPCTMLGLPENVQTDVGVSTPLTWYSSQAADGYALSFGTDNPPTNLLNRVDMGVDTVYTPVAELEYGQTYYWQVDVFMGTDTTSGCAIRSFTTKSTIQIPYTSSFENCQMPSGWIQESTTDSTIWSVQESNMSNGIPCELQAHSVNANGTSRFISPALPTSEVDTLILQFNQFFDDKASGLVLRIESSPDGENWTAESWSQQSGFGDIGPAIESLEITNNLGDYTFISFIIEGNHNSFDYWYLDDVFIFDKHGIPPCSYAIQPENGMTVLAIDTLKWHQTPITNNYKFFMGTDFPPTNIYYDTTISTTYFTPDVLLPVNDTIYLQVIPSNINGDGQACNTWSFYIEFEGVFPPANLQAEVQNYFDAHLTWSEPVIPMEDSVFIIDVDATKTSGPIIYNTISSLGINAVYSTTFPAVVSDYSAVFVCLGIYSTNTALNSTQGQLLADYLNSGGNLYMEGGDTWVYDSQTAAHTMFNINGLTDGTSDMGIVSGLVGTFTANMIFNYSGENNYMDHISPISPAFSFFENQSPIYGTGVAYDAGTYKTIGVSHEFGGLNNGASPSTKEELMAKYLEFFGLYTTKQQGQKGFLGYNVYREGIKLNTEPVTELFYNDNDLLPDEYDYYITSIYNEGESGSSNIATITIENHNLLNLKVFLEGPYYEGEMTPYLNAFDYLPLNQPYDESPWDYSGLESVSAIPNGDVIDWVLVELRETTGDSSTAISSTIIDKKACFLLLDGSIVDTSCLTIPDFKVPVNENLYIVIHHRNHLSIMSAEPLTNIEHVYTYDCSDSENKVYGGSLGFRQLDTNIWGMSSGDGNADKQINNIDKNDIWLLHYGEVGYFRGDFDMNSFDYIQDIGEKWKNNSGKSSQVPE